MKFNQKLLSFLFLGGVLSIVSFFIYQLNQNLTAQKIATGFDFLAQEAGFEISESVIEYDSFMSYSKALVVGVVNTLKVALLGNVLAFFVGLFIGVGSLSSHPLVSLFCRRYVHTLRNIPLLLQLFFWYALFTDIFPSVREAWSMNGFLISNRGFYFPLFDSSVVGWSFIALELLLAIGLIWLIFVRWRPQSKGLCFISMLLVGSFILFGLGGLIFDVNVPQLSGFNIEGGGNFSPELTSLLLGLVLYTGAFMAEIIRAGILSVEKGQTEAALALGMNDWQVMKLIILPQSFRVSLPPLIAQFLNLTKNSSLAVAIGYPDFVSIANTTMNQTGQAIELIFLIMLVYLTFSLMTSLVMNQVNKRLMTW